MARRARGALPRARMAAAKAKVAQAVTAAAWRWRFPPGRAAPPLRSCRCSATTPYHAAAPHRATPPHHATPRHRATSPYQAQKLLGFSGDLETLDRPERVLRSVADIPRLQGRIQAMIFKAQLESESLTRT